MSLSAAFAELGYKQKNVRWSWAAKNQNGIAITLWRSEISKRDGTLVLDTRTDGGPLHLWRDKLRNKERMNFFESATIPCWVDCIIREDSGRSRSGAPSIPWDVTARREKWKLVFFDPKTGHFRVELHDYD